MSGVLSRLVEVIRWYPKDMPANERRLVHKIDLLVLSYACLSFFTKYLDVSALSNAYVSGMKDDLNLYGNRLNYINAAYEVGYVVFQIPSNLVLSKIPAQYWLPAAEIFWEFFTLGTAFVKSYPQLVVMRFFVGLSATSCYVGLVHVINSWFKKSELGRRNAIFYISSPIGQMFAGYLQAAAFKNLNNHHGLAGWRWLFVICTVITIPIAALGFTVFPDLPGRTKSRFLTEEEKELAVSRLQTDGFEPPLGLNKTLWKRVLGIWQYYAFVILLVAFYNIRYASSTPYLLWLKSQPERYSIPTINNLGTLTNAVAIVSALTTSWYTDLRGKRWEPVIFAGVLSVFSNMVLAVWNIPNGLKFFAYTALGWVDGTSPILIAWMAEAFAGDLEARAVSLASFNCIAEITALVVPLIAWPVSKAPEFRGGFIWASAISVICLLNAGSIIYLQRRKKIQTGSVDETAEEVFITTKEIQVTREMVD